MDDIDRGAYARAVATLTDRQRRAVDSPTTAMCVIAGAGSGKTRVLTLRAARRIEDGSADADHSVIVTFTRKAADDLRARLRSFGLPVAIPSTRSAGPGPGVRTGTLHQLALTLLRRHAIDSERPLPVVVDDRFRMVLGLVGDATMAPAIDSEIAWAKSRCLTPDSYIAAAAAAGRVATVAADQVARHFSSYQAGLARRRALDLDDVVTAATDLVLGDETFAEGVRWRYRHLSVDEFQDINPDQYRFIEALMGDRRDLFVVGDPNQSIYGWRGADPELIGRLPLLVAGIEVVQLDENHRCSPQVVAAAAAALGDAAHGIPRASGPPGPLPVVTVYDDETAEAEGVAARLSAREDSDQAWSDQAVLARTNGQLRAIGQALGRAGIPFRMAPAPESPSADLPTTGAPGPGSPTPAPCPTSSPSGSRSGLRGVDDAVELATFHRAKGLEWESVYVVGIEDGFVPIVHAGTAAAIDEERRLLYVALTRASRRLYCSWARSRSINAGRRMEREPSPWLAAVARVSGPEDAKADPVDVGRRIAELRNRLDR